MPEFGHHSVNPHAAVSGRGRDSDYRFAELQKKQNTTTTKGKVYVVSMPGAASNNTLQGFIALRPGVSTIASFRDLAVILPVGSYGSFFFLWKFKNQNLIFDTRTRP